MRTRLLLATNNAHKINELRHMLEPESFRVLTPHDIDLRIDVPETGTTFEENATLKVEAFARESGLLCLADDSGLVVDALGGAPGVLSARYGGQSVTDTGRNDLVLDQLRDVPESERTARFVAVIAVSGVQTETRVFHGVVEGRIARTPSGSRGFGYDPIFFYPPFGGTFASVHREMKDAVSHRGIALRAALVYLRGLGTSGILV